MLSSKKSKSSLDYPRLAQEVLKASGKEGISKLPAGLYIVATPIGHRGDITLRALLTLSQVNLVACEDTRNTSSLLKAYGINTRCLSYHDHNEISRIPEILKRIVEGEAIALTSDAGLPLIADPGFRLVKACRDQNHLVTVIPGANAALTALVGSGLSVHNFYFMGFLPPKTTARKKALLTVKEVQATLIFYESAQRLVNTLTDLREIFGPSRSAVVARELTKLHEETTTGTLEYLENQYRNAPTKGEIVILVGERPQEENALPDQDLDELLKEALRTMSLRDAVTMICQSTHRKKSEVYARALWLAKGNTPIKK